jgi:hypothetical protein
MSLLDFEGVGLLREPLEIFRWIAVAIAVITAWLAVIAMVFRDSDLYEQPNLYAVGRMAYRLSDKFGQGEIAFTPSALVSIVGYYQDAPTQQLWLLFVWTIFVTIRPAELAIRIVGEITAAAKVQATADSVGTITRVDNPNIIRVALNSEAEWQQNSIVTACLPDHSQVNVLCMFTHIQETQLVGTGLVYGSPKDALPNGVPGRVYRTNDSANPEDILNNLSGTADGAALIGFVVEDSSISAIKFEVSPTASLEEGVLTFCRQGQQIVYYQIIDAKTAEEAFERNPRGKHVVVATQLGGLDPEKGFVKYGWLPSMNTPVFRSRQPISFNIASTKQDDFSIGIIPGSQVSVTAGLLDLVEYHTAILGVTGTGKTEFAFDVIRKALALGVKVFCVDFTNEYRQRLSDSSPEILGLDDKLATELDQMLFAVESGEYGAGKEKKALKLFTDQIREPVKKTINTFLSREGSGLGIFELPEIMNTKATLRATELYLSSIMEWARKNRRARKILIVLEEAHTIIPETAGSGFDYDTQWVVGRISQIALQGRKYGVGLLVISQRTALVSKSILSQCNTCFTFALVDKTSLDYLANVYSSRHVQAIPNLRFLEAIAYGKGVRSERPLLVKLRYDQAKKDASEALNKQLSEKVKLKST